MDPSGKLRRLMVSISYSNTWVSKPTKIPRLSGENAIPDICWSILGGDTRIVCRWLKVRASTRFI